MCCEIWLIKNGIAYVTNISEIRFGTIPGRESDDPDEDVTIVRVTIETPSKCEAEYIVSYQTISGKYLSQFSKVYKINTGAVGQYDVRSRCIYKYQSASEDAHRIYWAKLSHIVYDDFVFRLPIRD